LVGASALEPLTPSRLLKNQFGVGRQA